MIASSVIMSAVNFPDFWNDLEGSPEKNSLRSDALYAFFNKSLVFRSVISNWDLIRSLLFTLQRFLKTNMLLEWEWKIVDSWWQFILKQLDISEIFSYSHANLYSPEVSKMLLHEVKWATFYNCNVPHNQFELHFKNCHIWKHTDSFPLT